MCNYSLFSIKLSINFSSHKEWVALNQSAIVDTPLPITSFKLPNWLLANHPHFFPFLPLTLIQCAWQNPIHPSRFLSNNTSSSEPFLISLSNSRKQHVQPCIPRGPQNNIRSRRRTQKVSNSVAAISSLGCLWWQHPTQVLKSTHCQNKSRMPLCQAVIKVSGDSCRNLSGWKTNVVALSQISDKLPSFWMRN